MMGLGLTKTNINEFGRLDELKKSVDKAKAKAYFEKRGRKADTAQGKPESGQFAAGIYCNRRLRGVRLHIYKR